MQVRSSPPGGTERPHRERLAGTPGNRAATVYAASIIEGIGLTVECPGFRCLGWERGEAILEDGAEYPFPLFDDGDFDIPS